MAEVFDFGLQQHKIKMDGKFFENNLFAVVGDTGRRLEVQLLNSNNMVQNTTGISLRLNAVVAGQATYAEATLVDAIKGLYKLDLPNGMLLAPGNWQFQWQIIGANGEKLHSFVFTGSIGSNLSEGGSEATNFYLNVENLKKMQDDLVNGTFNSEVLETNIAEKLNNLENQYAPKLTEVTAQLAQKASITYVDAILMDIAKGGPNSGPQGPFMSLAALYSHDFTSGKEGTWLVFDTSFGDGAHSFMWDSTNSIWKDLGVYQSTDILKGSIKQEHLAFHAVEGTIGKNLFNTSTISKGNYVDYLTGKSLVAAGFNISEYIPVIEGSALVTSGHAQQQFAWYSSNNENSYISGEIMWIPTKSKTVPTGAKYLRITVRDEDLHSFQLEYNTVATEYEHFNYVVTSDKLGQDAVTLRNANKELFEKKETIITVKKDGSGDFFNIPLALASITDNSAKKPYRLLIGEGEFTDIEWHMKPYVSLEGKTPQTSWIRGELPNTSSDTEVRQAQTFWWNVTGCQIKNLKITAKNMMYPIHADAGAYGNKDGELDIVNCDVKHLGNQAVIDHRIANGMPHDNVWRGVNPIGLGMSDGMKVYIKDTKLNDAFYVHNNGDFERGSFVRLNNCSMDEVTIQNMGSRVSDIVEMNGCTVNGNVIYSCPSWLSSIPNNEQTNLAETKLCGTGNIITGNFVNDIWRVGTGKDYKGEFTGINQLGWVQ